MSNDSTGTVHDLPQIRWQTGRAQQFHRCQRDQRGLVIRLEHDRIASDERGQAVGDRHGHRIVPRSDDTDDPFRHVIAVDSSQQRKEALAALRAQIATRSATVVARRQRNVQHLLGRTQSCLADGLQKVDEMVTPIQKMIMKVQ